VEAAAGDNLVKMSDAEKEALWQKAKTGAI
jgi:hypothetical protein